MATKIEIQDFREQIAKGVHNFASHTFRLVFSNDAPAVTDTMKTDVTRVSLTNTSGGDVDPSVTITTDETTTPGTMVIKGNAVTLTATGAVGPFRYYSLYNDTATAPLDALVLAWDHGSSVTLATNETFKVSFNGTDVAGTIMTIA